MAQTPRVYARDVGGIGPHIRRFPYLAEVILPAAAFGTIGRLSAQAGAVERSRASGLDRCRAIECRIDVAARCFPEPFPTPTTVRSRLLVFDSGDTAQCGLTPG